MTHVVCYVLATLFEGFSAFGRSLCNFARMLTTQRLIRRSRDQPHSRPMVRVVGAPQSLTWSSFRSETAQLACSRPLGGALKLCLKTLQRCSGQRVSVTFYICVELTGPGK